MDVRSSRSSTERVRSGRRWRPRRPGRRWRGRRRTARGRCRRPRESSACGGRRGVSSSDGATCRSSMPASASRRDQVAVAHPRERAADGGLGRDVDGGRDLAGRAGHPAVGDERDPVAAVLQHAERRGQLVQLGHAVGAPGPGSGSTATRSPVERAAPRTRRRKSAWSSNTRAGASTSRCSGLTAEVLITARPRLPSSIRRPPSRGERVVGRAQHVGVVAALRALLPGQLAVAVERAASVV